MGLPLVVFAQLFVHAKQAEAVVQAQTPLGLLLVGDHALMVLNLLYVRTHRTRTRTQRMAWHGTTHTTDMSDALDLGEKK